MALEAVWLGGRFGGASLSDLMAGSLAGLILANQVSGVSGTLPRHRPA